MKIIALYAIFYILITVLIHPISLLWINDSRTSYNNSKFAQGLKNALKAIIQKNNSLHHGSWLSNYTNTLSLIIVPKFIR